jgi:HlyD family secretion protein
MSQQNNQPSKWRGGLPMGLGVASVFVLVAVLGGWGSQAKLAGAVIASGAIEVESRRQVVQHEQGGLVSEILVTEGDLVQAGEVVLRLDDSLIRPELAIINDQLFEIRARRVRLIAERDGTDTMPDADIDFDTDLSPSQQERFLALFDGQRRLFLARKVTVATTLDLIGEQVLQMDEQITGAEAVLEAMAFQLSLLEKQRADMQLLYDKNLVAIERLYQLQREEAALRGQVGNTYGQIAQMRARISELKMRGLSEEVGRREEAITRLRDFGLREAELLEKRRILMQRLQRLDVRSPATGRVFGMRIFTVNSIAKSSEELMFIVPGDQPLVVNARINAIDVDKMFVGQDATLRFSALDARSTPEIDGKVVHVSADALVDQQSGMSFFEARVAPDLEQLALLGDQKLLPGMPAEAYITTSERTPLQYLIKPLADYFNKAWREE